MSSDFVRGVFGVSAVGLLAGIGVLLMIPQSSPSATAQLVEPPAGHCPQTKASADRGCQNGSAQRHGTKRGGLASDPTQQSVPEDESSALAQARADAAAMTPQEKPVTPARTATPPKRLSQNAGAAQPYRTNGAQYYYGTRQRGAAMGNGFFPLFR